jgi:Uma2 family endonuclease
VSAHSIPKLFTVEEYEQIPNPPGGRYELHHGELVFVTYPVRQHGDLQRRLQELLQPAARPAGYLVAVEYPYRPLPQCEVWGADVACILQSRHRSAKDWVVGSPELVIEVKSPSNRDAELHDKAMTALLGGAVEFWIVDAKTRSVRVYSKTVGAQIYRKGSVPVPLFDCRIEFDILFAEDQ